MSKKNLIYLPNLPKKFDFRNSILIYDSFFESKPEIQSWIKLFSQRYRVESGEALKDINHFALHMSALLKLYEEQKQSGSDGSTLQIVSLGGGSVGDFSGFAASVIKRGVGLVHFPTTWLAAIDSAHGGKTALNVNSFKNQIGSFYPAQKIYLIRQILLNQPPERAHEALGEAIKIALIDGGSLWKKLSLWQQPDAKKLWQLLPQMIEAKYKIVRKDPFEKKGLRAILNLGHTLGHVLESQLKMPHGLAVLYGLQFAILFSSELNILRKKDLQKIQLSAIYSQLPSVDDLKMTLNKCIDLKSALMADKKSGPSGQVKFIFIAAPGRVKAKSISVLSVLKFAHSL